MLIIFIVLDIFLRGVVVVEDFEEFARRGFAVKLFYLPAPSVSYTHLRAHETL